MKHKKSDSRTATEYRSEQWVLAVRHPTGRIVEQINDYFRQKSEVNAAKYNFKRAATAHTSSHP
jgi:hypothetical protein